MSFKCLQSIPSPEEMIAEIPVPSHLKKIKEERDAEFKRIIEGKSDKFVVIIGPCSASDEDAVCDYVSRLAKVNEKVQDKLFIVPRVYTNHEQLAKATKECYTSLTQKKAKIF